MDRRGFLKLAAKAAVTAAGVAVLGTEVLADPERALWEPGKKRIFDFGRSHLGVDCGSGDLGISLRMTKPYDVSERVIRFDVLYGFSTLRPDLALRDGATST